jgi:hypothetical protein
MKFTLELKPLENFMKTPSLYPTIQKFTSLGLIALVATSLSIVGTTAVSIPAMAQQIRPYSINPNVALDGNWGMTWRVSGVTHRARLSMNGNFGTMIVNVRLPNGQLVAVEEEMTLTPTANGFVLRGSTPTYPGSSTPIPNYNPDVFRIRPANNGRLNVTNCSSGFCVPVTMRHL